MTAEQRAGDCIGTGCKAPSLLARIEKLCGQLTAKDSEIERLRTDAARYHWLRSEHPNVHAFWQRAAREKSLTLEIMDRVIDTLRPDDDVEAPK